MQAERDDFERLGPAGEADASAAAARSVRRAEAIDAAARVPLHPRGVGAICDLGLQFAIARFAPAVVLATVLWLPVQAMLAFYTTRPDLLPAGSEEQGEAFALNLGLQLLSGLMALVTGAITSLLAVDGFRGTHTPLFVALRRGLARVPGLMVLGFLCVLLIVAGLVVFCVGAWVAWWIVVLVPTVYVLEWRPLGETLTRAFRLSFVRLATLDAFFGLMRWTGVYFVLLFFSGGFTGLAAWSVTHEVRSYVLENTSIPYSTYTALSIGVGAVFMAVGTVIQAGFMTAYWVDCCERRDGLDLQAWITRLRRDTEPRTPAAAPAGS